MASKTFAGMNVGGLLDLRDAIDAKLHGLRDALVAQLAAIGGGKKKRGRPAKTERVHALKGRKAAAKFRDPKTGATWAGRGMTPKWLAIYEAAGRSRDEFATGAVMAAVAKNGKKRGRKPGRPRKKVARK